MFTGLATLFFVVTIIDAHQLPKDAFRALREKRSLEEATENENNYQCRNGFTYDDVYPGECRSYYRCSDGDLSTHKCFFLKRFDPTRLTCRWFFLVNCHNSPTTPIPPEPYPSTEEPQSTVIVTVSSLSPPGSSSSSSPEITTQPSSTLKTTTQSSTTQTSSELTTQPSSTLETTTQSSATQPSITSASTIQDTTSPATTQQSIGSTMGSTTEIPVTENPAGSGVTRAFCSSTIITVLLFHFIVFMV